MNVKNAIIYHMAFPHSFPLTIEETGFNDEPAACVKQSVMI